MPKWDFVYAPVRVRERLDAVAVELDELHEEAEQINGDGARAHARVRARACVRACDRVFVCACV